MQKTPANNRSAATTAPVEIPPRPACINPQQIEFLRLPPVGQRCQVTGMSRAALNALILPTPANGNKPPVKSFCLRQRGARTGIRLIDYQSLRGFILAHADGDTPATSPRPTRKAMVRS
ncbi:MAG: hypothetical protein ABR955_06635 [Verrucomicrobiota bacterium]